MTVWLAGDASSGVLTGLTVSSVLVAQGEPPLVAGLVAPLSDLAEAVRTAGAGFVVHVLADGHQRLAKHFSGELPAPADLLSTTTSPYGPVLDAVAERLCCRTRKCSEFGWSTLVEAEIEDITTAAAGRGLAWYRGAFIAIVQKPA